MPKVGDRVMAISHTREGKVFVFGCGVYVGDNVPGPEAAGFMAEILRLNSDKKPCIELDTGQKIWGCECFWGEEAHFKAKYEKQGFTFVEADLTKARAESKALVEKDGWV